MERNNAVKELIKRFVEHLEDSHGIPREVFRKTKKHMDGITLFEIITEHKDFIAAEKRRSK